MALPPPLLDWLPRLQLEQWLVELLGLETPLQVGHQGRLLLPLRAVGALELLQIWTS